MYFDVLITNLKKIGTDVIIVLIKILHVYQVKRYT